MDEQSTTVLTDQQVLDRFREVRKDRETQTGRTCVDMAESLVLSACGSGVATGDGLASMREARQWLKLGLDADRKSEAGLLREIEEQIERKRNRSSNRENLRVVNSPDEI